MPDYLPRSDSPRRGDDDAPVGSQKPRTRGRSRDAVEVISDNIDRVLANLLKHGRPLVDRQGAAVLDAAGQPIMQPATSAELGLALRRLRDVGLSDQKRLRLIAAENEREGMRTIKRAKILPFQRSRTTDGAA